MGFGDYSDTAGATQGLVDMLSDGTWTSTELPLPTDAASNPSPYVDAVSCPMADWCVAVGRYLSVSGNEQGVIESMSEGTWTPTEVSLPSNASSYQPYGVLNNVVTCPTVSSCVAVGDYNDTSGGVHAVIDTLSGDSWTVAEAPLPSTGTTLAQVTTLFAITCPVANTCVAIGSYGGNGLIESLNGGPGPLRKRLSRLVASDSTSAPSPVRQRVRVSSLGATRLQNRANADSSRLCRGEPGHLSRRRFQRKPVRTTPPTSTT